MTGLVAAVEAGGTSFVACVANISDDDNKNPEILFRRNVDSSHDKPHKTLDDIANFFEQHKPESGYRALGVATFGPVGLVKGRKNYGCILPGSPKQAWRSVDLLTPLTTACQGKDELAVKIETDVNAPALAEYLLVKDQVTSVAYVTVGTGVGVGLVINGESVHGFLHPEGGHVPIQPLPDDNFDGYSWGSNSPFKGKSTVEGMTSSVALTERLEIMTGKKDLLRSSLVELEDDHEIWNHAANALANLSVTLILTTSIEKIVFGGGVMNRNGMIEKIRKRTIELLNGYLELPDISSMITLSSYGADVGLTGAILLAQQAIESENGERKSKKSFITPPFMAGICHGIIVGAGVAFLGMIMLRAIKK